MAIEITAAGIDVEKVRPAFSPKYTFAAVNTSVMMIPMIRPRMVSSVGMFAVIYADRWKRRIVWNHRMGQDVAVRSESLYWRDLALGRGDPAGFVFTDYGSVEIRDFCVDLLKGALREFLRWREVFLEVIYVLLRA